MTIGIILGIISLTVFICLIVLPFVLIARKNKHAIETRETDATHEEQGNWGERTVADILNSCALEGDKIISNLIIKNPKTGMTAEIDHIFLSTRGCLVIEVKDYSGTIYGEEDEKTWRQVMGWDEMVVNSFYSPIKQNETHIFTLKQVLHTHVYMENIVVFVQGNTQNIRYKNIFTLDQLADYLNQIAKTSLSEEKRDELYNELIELQGQAVSKQEHVQNIHELQWKIENNICPRCGKSLVLRKGPYGEFYGCSGYPDCKFKKRLEN